MKDIRNIAVIGSGLMGCGIAQVFASHPGHTVTTFDSFTPGKVALERILGNLNLLAGKGVLTEGEITAVLARITPCETLAQAVATADLVVEVIPEQMALKQDLFAELEAICPTYAVLATGTSVMSVTEIGSRMKTRHRLVGTHFWNPPYLIPLVEVVRSEFTDPEAVEATVAVLKACGKHPVRVNRDVPGFLANRLQHALWREAISIVEHGIADAASVDEAIRLGFGLRLPILGPMENADMVGTDLTLAIHNYILPHLENSPTPSPLLVERVEKGELGFKTGQGFQTWTPQDIDASRKRLINYLIDVLYPND